MKGNFDDIAIGFFGVFDFLPGVKFVDGQPAFPVFEGGLVVVEDFADVFGGGECGSF